MAGRGACPGGGGVGVVERGTYKSFCSVYQVLIKKLMYIMISGVLNSNLQNNGLDYHQLPCVFFFVRKVPISKIIMKIKFMMFNNAVFTLHLRYGYE